MADFYRNPLPSLAGGAALMAVILTSGMIVREEPKPAPAQTGFWQAPPDRELPPGPAGAQIRYGRQLIAHTADYLGPKGTVAKLSNGLNCQNCHLDAGTRVFGNNYSAVVSTYPKFRERSGKVESVVKRVSDCFERSLNGKAPDSASREMKAVVAYLTWLGKAVPKGQRPPGVGLLKLPFLDRPADPTRGRAVYLRLCQSCHGPEGQGVQVPGVREYVYPPLWGPHSYGDGAGMYRLGNLAGYVKVNMPYGTASYNNYVLTDEEAWDVAAFINSQPRPHQDQSRDWPDLKTKPVDFPFGPYADSFSEAQHKYGPFGPIAAARN
jgi:thiosulfate dehydrogenase